MQDSHIEFSEFTVFNKFAQVAQRCLLTALHVPRHRKDGLNHCTLEFVATLIAKHTSEERQHRRLLGGELERQAADCIDDNDFELVANVRHKSADLLDKAVDTRLVACFQQRRDRIRSDTAVWIGNEALHVDIARLNRRRPHLRQFGERSHSCKLEHRAWR